MQDDPPLAEVLAGTYHQTLRVLHGRTVRLDMVVQTEGTEPSGSTSDCLLAWLWQIAELSMHATQITQAQWESAEPKFVQLADEGQTSYDPKYLPAYRDLFRYAKEK